VVHGVRRFFESLAKVAVMSNLLLRAVRQCEQNWRLNVIMLSSGGASFAP